MGGRVVVVGLGPAGPDLIGAGTLAAVAAVPVRFVRTLHHPSAAAIGEATGCDDLYDSAGSLEEVYAGIVERLVTAAQAHGEVLYAVPGSPRVAERSVEQLAADGRVAVEVHPALSFLDLAWDRLGVDPLAAGVRLVDGRRFAVEAAGERGPLLVAQCDAAAVLSDIKLAVEVAPETVVVLQRLGLPDETVVELEWADLDRVVEADHLTSLWIPQLASPVGAELVGFVELVRTLRASCPWDREQTHASLTRHLLEETYELLEAIGTLGTADDSTDGEVLDAAYAHLEEELGDVLFQVCFHAALAAEAGRFDMADVARGIHEKLVRRHPHVFAGVEVADSAEVVRNWEEIKRAEKGRTSGMEGVPANLPSLLYASKAQRKATTLGIEVEVPASLDLGELARSDGSDDAVGAALFAVVAAARRAGVDPETALRVRAARFVDDVVAGDSNRGSPS